jgi:hypothetical protein
VQARLEAFMAEEIYPNEEALFAQVDEGDRWQPVPLLYELKAKARAQGLWNLFLPDSQYGAGPSNTRRSARSWPRPLPAPRERPPPTFQKMTVMRPPVRRFGQAHSARSAWVSLFSFHAQP